MMASQNDNQTSWYEGIPPQQGGVRAYEGAYKDGKEHGKWTWWHKNGKKKSEGTYKEGDEHGKWTYWYVNGQKKSEGTYKDGLVVSKWTYWYENGQKESEGTLKGKKTENASGTVTSFEEIYDGKWTFWDGNGQVTREAIYEDGELIEEKIYSPE